MKLGIKRYITEAKIDNEYNKNYSDIDRDIFDTIVAMDPRALKDSTGGVDKMGFITKQLLLPRYRAGETDFLNNPEAVTKAITSYMSDSTNLREHPISTFKSVADFINYLNDPAADIEFHVVEKPKSPVDKIYDQYYSEIPRAEFDKIISIDPQTTEDRIGIIARNLLLPEYLDGNHEFINNDKLSSLCKSFYDDKNTYAIEMQDLNNYPSVNDFIEYVSNPDSNLVANLKRNERIDPLTHRPIKDDFRLVGSTREYDILEPKSNKANAAISGGWENTNGMLWCTGSENTSKWWRNYTDNGGRIFCFMNKAKNRGSENRSVNWQICIPRGGDYVSEFLNGYDRSPSFPGYSRDQQFENFLKAYPDICYAIRDKEPFDRIGSVQRAYASNRLANEPFILDSRVKLNELLTQDLSAVIKSVEVNIPKIPAGLFADFILLDEVKLNNVVEIGPQAFKNCIKLRTIAFPDTLKIIGSEAFAGCELLKGSIVLPDSVEEIRAKAFKGTHCKLKIDENRTNPIKFDESDENWVISSVKSIKVQ